MTNIRPFEGNTPRIAENAWVDERALVIGDVVLGAQASLWPGVVVRGDIHSIRIGERSNIQDNSVLHVSHDSVYRPGGEPLEIGDEVTVGHRVILHGCRVGSRCLIGMGAIVMDGAELESGLILGAASLVPEGRRLEGGYLWLGTPVRRQRALKPREIDCLAYSAAHYVKLAARHQAEY